MSKISLQPNASGAGTFSIVSPDSNTNRTLTLPDEEGTVATIENIPPGYEDQDALDLFNVSGSAPVFACRAWVNFNGTGTVAIRDSGNVSSITDNGTGNYTVNFATAMPDANYSVVVGGNNGSGTTFSNARITFSGFPNTTQSARITSYLTASNSFEDRDTINAAIFR